MSVRRGFVIRLRGTDTTDSYLKPDKGYTVDLLKAQVYPTPEAAEPDLPAVRAYGSYTRKDCSVTVRACTFMASLD